MQLSIIYSTTEIAKLVMEAMKKIEKISASAKVSKPRTTGSSTRIETEATYSRTMRIPQERHKNRKDKMLRKYSCPSPHPSDVHPKLPDYDDIVMFILVFVHPKSILIPKYSTFKINGSFEIHKG